MRSPGFVVVCAILAAAGCGRTDVRLVTCPSDADPAACGLPVPTQAMRIADLMERFGVVTFSEVPATESVPAFNPFGSAGDYSAAGVVDCVKYLTADSGLTLRLREYHGGDASSFITQNQQSWCPTVAAQTGARFTVGLNSGASSASDVDGLRALAASSASTGNWLEMLQGDNDPSSNGVDPATAIATQAQVQSAAATAHLASVQMLLPTPLPYDGSLDAYANTNADFAAMHGYPEGSPNNGEKPGGAVFADAIVAAQELFGPAPLIIGDWHPTLYSPDHALDPTYDAYFAPIFMLSAFVDYDVSAYFWFAMHDYGPSLQAGLFTDSVSTPKPVADTIRAMYALTGDSGVDKRSFTPDSLELIVTGLPPPIGPSSPGSGGRTALFENSSGTFFLFVWNEQTDPGGDASAVTVTLARAATQIVDYAISSAGAQQTALQTLASASSIAIALDASVHLVVITP